ncbi:MAG: Na+/H+ antiporter NhaC family protein, partial [Xanthomonadales bacterium]|nr:Na+/H+ antiporter NhaC family protein [Xanthomonadales bacterium]
ITTWIGAEVGYIGDALSKSGGSSESAYIIFLRTIPYSFYPLLTLLFVGFIAFGRRDFGPMLKAERLALTQAAGDQSKITNTDIIEPMADKPQRSINAIIPILVLITSLIGGLFATGEGDTLKDIIGSSNSYKALMWASMLAVLSAAILSIAQRILTVEDVVESWFSGARVMLMAMAILLLAWALGETTESLGTANFLVALLGEGFPAWILPTLVFVLSAATAFATGSSWGTMGILMPLVVPLSLAIMQASGIAQPLDAPLFAATIAGVLGGAVWGDHCSPISDTTIMSSMATGCDHIEHVQTQLPYAMTVGLVAIVFGTLPAGFGLPWWASLLAGATALMLIYRYMTVPISPDD